MISGLKQIDLGGNMLTGPIPSEFGTFSALEALVLGKHVWPALRHVNGMFDCMLSKVIITAMFAIM